MAQYKPYEAPDFMKQYAETATTPFARSALGQFLANKEAEEIMDDRYEQPIDANMPETGVPEEGIDMSSMATMAKGPGKYMFTGLPKANVGKSLLAKTLPKQAAKWGIKGGLRFIPGVGWAMAGLDLMDYLAPEGYRPYDYIPGGEYLTWRDTE